MKKLLSIKQVSTLFGGITPTELQNEIDNGGILLPTHHVVAGASMWWSHQVEASMRAQFGKRSHNSKIFETIKKAVTDRLVGFRGGFVSINALRSSLGVMPAGQYVAGQLSLHGYVHVMRCVTSPSELHRFPDAPKQSRIYHDGRASGSPATIMALYDAAQRVDMPLQPRQ